AATTTVAMPAMIAVLVRCCFLRRLSRTAAVRPVGEPVAALAMRLPVAALAMRLPVAASVALVALEVVPELLAAVAAVVEAPDEPFDDLLFFDFFLAMSYRSYLFGSHFEHELSTLLRRLLRLVEPAHERWARRYLNSPSVDASCSPPPDSTPLASSLPSS